jgi:hypothetical protein
MICCLLGALLLVNLIIWGRKIIHHLGIKKIPVEAEFIKTDSAGNRYYIDQFGKKLSLNSHGEDSLGLLSLEYAKQEGRV